MNDWLALVKKHAGTRSNGEEPLIALCGTKGDLAHLRVVKQNTHQALVDSENLRGSYFVSAKIGDGIEMMFKQV